MTYLKASLTSISLPFTTKILEITPLFFIEIFLTILAFKVVLETTKEKRHGWVLNITKKFLALGIYFLKGLYVKCTLDVILIMKSFYGWYNWGPKTKNKHHVTKQVTALTWKEMLFFCTLAASSTLILGYVYGQYFSSSLPYLDGLHAAMSLINYYLLAKKKREAWLFCLTGQLVYIYVCYAKGMFFLFKYILYVFLSLRGLYQWNQAYQNTQLNSPKAQT